MVVLGRVIRAAKGIDVHVIAARRRCRTDRHAPPRGDTSIARRRRITAWLVDWSACPR